MYKILIVDDEKMIRQGIKKVIPWESIGIGPVFTAATGKEALEILKREKPQIMVTDIQMTEMTGLELIRETKDIVPELRVIVLTGYDNFEYARQGLRLQIQEFLLKPIDEDDLMKALVKQVEYLDGCAREQKLQKNLQRTQGSIAQMRLEACIRRLIHGDSDKEEILGELKQSFLFERDQDMECVLLAPALYMGQNSPEEDFRVMSVKNVCMDLVDSRKKGITFTDEDGVIAIVYFEDEGEKSVLDAVQELSDILRDEFEGKPQMAVGGLAHGFENLLASYNDARYLLNHEKESVRDVVSTLGARNRVEIFRDIYEELKTIMCSSIGDPAAVMKGFRTFMKASESYNLSAATTRRCCFEIASVLYFTYMEESGEAGGVKLNALSGSLVSSGREEACEVTRSFLEQLLDKGDENVHDIITRAKHYIDEHLSEDISVSSIAAGLYVTPNYFSRLFKRVTKEGCSEYIVRKRIEKARCLLETTNMRTGRIAMMVGYRDTNYFSLAFKKHTGKTPTKYREDMRGERHEESETCDDRDGGHDGGGRLTGNSRGGE